MIQVDSTSALAVDGATWSQLQTIFPSLLPLVATRGVIFARMSPQQKAHVVETLQSLDYIVAMVGDGANDCGVSFSFSKYTTGEYLVISLNLSILCT